MASIQEVMDLARIEINDSSTARYPDSELLKYANNGIALCYSIRPDLRFGSYSTAFVDLVATSTFPLPIEYRPAVAAYIVSANQSGDDSFVISERAQKAMTDYIRGLGIG